MIRNDDRQSNLVNNECSSLSTNTINIDYDRIFQQSEPPIYDQALKLCVSKESGIIFDIFTKKNNQLEEKKMIFLEIPPSYESVHVKTSKSFDNIRQSTNSNNFRDINTVNTVDENLNSKKPSNIIFEN